MHLHFCIRICETDEHADERVPRRYCEGLWVVEDKAHVRFLTSKANVQIDTHRTTVTVVSTC